MPIVIRAADAGDLADLCQIFYLNELGEEAATETLPMLPEYRHLLNTGTILLAEDEGGPIGFAGRVDRGGVAYLTDLFVRPDSQSVGIGGRLLDAIFAPTTGVLRCTVSSADERALALYVRAGLTPHVPNLLLRGRSARLSQLDGGVSASVARDDDLVRADASRSGRWRPQDHTYWREREGGVGLWLERGGDRIGYAVVRLRAGTPFQPDVARVGPVGADTAADAAAVVCAAVGWAAARAPAIRIDLPGPHPALRPLLAAGMLITYVETFVADGPAPFDPQRYASSGGALG